MLKILNHTVALCVFATGLIAGPIDVTGSASFMGGLTNSWIFSYTTGAPGLYLQSISIDLGPTGLMFDTAPGAPGSLSYLDIGGFNGTDSVTGLNAISATGAALDGGTQVAFNFDTFAEGDVFQFSADVDRPDPALLNLQSCAGKNGAALLLCISANAARTATNDARLLGAQTVGPNAMAGAVVTFQFGGDGYVPFSLSGQLPNVTLGEIVRGLIQGQGQTAFSSDITVTPEPASFATLAAGLLLLLAIFRSRRLPVAI